MGYKPKKYKDLDAHFPKWEDVEGLRAKPKNLAQLRERVFNVRVSALSIYSLQRI